MVPDFVSIAQRIGVLLFGLSVLSGFGRDVVGEMPALPTGFSHANAIVNAARAGEEPGGLDLTLRFNTLYDSNVTQESGGGQSDWRYTPRIEVDYLLGNSRWKLGARGTLEYNSYQKRDDFSGTNYSFGFFGGYQSKKLDASFTTGISSTSGINRLAGGFIEQNSFNGGLSASYRFSGKTSLNASWDQSLTESQSKGFGDTSSGTASVSALWKATPLISIGPGFRYGIRTGNDDEEFTLVGPILRLDYKLSTKVNLRSTIGIDYSDSPYSGKDTLVSWSLGLNYRASSLWGLDLETIQDTQATLSTGGGFDEISSFRLSYWRKIRRARVELAVSYEDRSATDSRPTLTVPRDFEFLTLSAALSLPVFRDRADLNFHVNWQDQTEADDDLSWDGFQTGLGLAWRF
ncbi:hypothetical protein N9A94_01310 [Akkermansiaceae bacterium]|nr:hypothetical protein [Akkermansiaceae bacterium]